MESFRKEKDHCIIVLSKETIESQKEIIHLEFLVKPGDKIQKGDRFAVAEGMKGTIDLECPISGVVSELNAKLKDSPEAAVGEWIIKVK